MNQVLPWYVTDSFLLLAAVCGLVMLGVIVHAIRHPERVPRREPSGLGSILWCLVIFAIPLVLIAHFVARYW